MAITKKQPRTYDGFAILLQPDTDLGLATLIAEDEEGHHDLPMFDGLRSDRVRSREASQCPPIVPKLSGL